MCAFADRSITSTSIRMRVNRDARGINKISSTTFVPTSMAALLVTTIDSFSFPTHGEENPRTPGKGRDTQEESRIPSDRLSIVEGGTMSARIKFKRLSTLQAWRETNENNRMWFTQDSSWERSAQCRWVFLKGAASAKISEITLRREATTRTNTKQKTIVVTVSIAADAQVRDLAAAALAWKMVAVQLGVAKEKSKGTQMLGGGPVTSCLFSSHNMTATFDPLSRSDGAEATAEKNDAFLSPPCRTARAPRSRHWQTAPRSTIGSMRD
ncbi:hypothetical protein HETIRDRAFT_117335 [Heterobasidion irregulare TC 32-1]|uniref:Uncharacterized protein n=1 Tax=Heterobasidion irregulare (strain TC 32-1) TaxID=747525 RepID=W4K0Y4_HETIT|nr:uncharacterized protein HETIRDRAFT_117335 [Heterobasidion irregulare TC 32-1]ETW79462.1 hypothetical protein HETIRDRAFT_117335 [Heterobasidion irregulare TC 32-1]